MDFVFHFKVVFIFFLYRLQFGYTSYVFLCGVTFRSLTFNHRLVRVLVLCLVEMRTLVMKGTDVSELRHLECSNWLRYVCNSQMGNGHIYDRSSLQGNVDRSCLLINDLLYVCISFLRLLFDLFQESTGVANIVPFKK